VRHRVPSHSNWSLPIRVSLSVVKFTSITQRETAGLRLLQSMQLLGATPFGKAPKSQALFQSLHQAYLYVNFAGAQVQYLVGFFVERNGTDTDFCPSTRLYPVIMIP